MLSPLLYARISFIIIFMVWTLVRGMLQTGRQEDQDGCTGSGDDHVFGNDLQHQIKESPLGKYRIRKESNYISKDLIIPIVLAY
jgi:hypothetical protein